MRGLHLHQSLSGEYVQRTIGIVPDELGATYGERFAVSYAHVLQIDRHEPWDDPVVADLVNAIGPEWVNNELSYPNRAKHNDYLRTQLRALNRRFAK